MGQVTEAQAKAHTGDLVDYGQTSQVKDSDEGEAREKR